MIIAIDPGQEGGIAWTHDCGTAFAAKMPDTIKGIHDFLDSLYADECDECMGKQKGACVTCYLEDVHALPHQSTQATWTFGRHYGALEGILLGLGYPVIKVRPQVWQKAIGASRPAIPKDATPAQKARIKAEGKHRIKEIVEARYPHLHITLATSDALGILMYAETLEKNR